MYILVAYINFHVYMIYNVPTNCTYTIYIAQEVDQFAYMIIKLSSKNLKTVTKNYFLILKIILNIFLSFETKIRIFGYVRGERRCFKKVFFFDHILQQTYPK